MLTLSTEGLTLLKGTKQCTMSFLGSLQQVVADVSRSVSNITLSPKRFPFGGRENSVSEEGPKHNLQYQRPGGAPRLGPMLVPSPQPSPRPRTKSFLNSQKDAGLGGGAPQVMVPPAKPKEREYAPLPVLQCGDRYAFWPEHDPSQTW